ncbi:hypothetical protein LAN31_21990, partial [Mycobacterium tuberculosis]|nr:hypothetical protein [Mycobacterium tuberculosis]
MTTYFTIGDFILLIPMALAGALFLGAVPCATEFRHNLLRVLGVILGVGVDCYRHRALPPPASAARRQQPRWPWLRDVLA